MEECAFKSSSMDLNPSILTAHYNHLGLKATQLLGPTRIPSLWNRVKHHLLIYFKAPGYSVQPARVENH